MSEKLNPLFSEHLSGIFNDKDNNFNNSTPSRPIIYVSPEEVLSRFTDMSIKPFISENNPTVEVPYEIIKELFYEAGLDSVFNEREVYLLNCISKEFEKYIKLTHYENIDRLKELGASDIGRIVRVEGFVKSMSFIEPAEFITIYYCNNCDRKIKHFIPHLDLENKSSVLHKCPRCGDTKGLERINSETIKINIRWILVEEPYDGREGSEVRSFYCIIKGGDELLQSNLNYGDKVIITGLFNDRIVKTARKKRNEFYIDVMNIETLESSYKSIEVTKEDKKKIGELAQKPEYWDLLKNNYMADFVGDDAVKDGLLCQAASVWLPGAKRGSINILLVGDPGVNKSTILRTVGEFHPKVGKSTGKNSTKAGLTAGSERKSESVPMIINPGLLPLKNDGLVLLDELDKTSQDVKDQLNEPLEDGVVTYNSIAGNTELPSRTTVLGAMNPTGGKLDWSDDVRKQIDNSDAFNDRFDLIYIIQDIYNETKEHQIFREASGCKQREFEKIDKELLIKMFSYFKQLSEPKISPEAVDVLEIYYHSMRKNPDSPKKITRRHIYDLMRISKAIARIYLKDVVDVPEAEKAVSIHKEMVKTWELKPLKEEPIKPTLVKEDLKED